MSSELNNIIEALMMVSDAPLSVAKIQGVFDKDATPSAQDIKNALKELQDECAERSFEVRKIGDGYRVQTKPQYAQWIRKFQAGRPPKLSRAQLETLAIIAYRQPVSRGDIEEIRGVAVSAEIMQRLTERDWIKQIGVRDVPGRPALFATTQDFLAYFNLTSLQDLPALMEQREFEEIAKDLDMPLPLEILAALEAAPLEVQPGGLAEDKLQEATAEEDHNQAEDKANNEAADEANNEAGDTVDQSAKITESV